MRAATERAAIRRGWVQPIMPAPSAGSASRHILGICVVLPEPVSPHRISTLAGLERSKNFVAPGRYRQIGIV